MRSIGFTFLLAGLVKGVVGLGLPTVAMGLLGLAMPPAQAAARHGCAIHGDQCGATLQRQPAAGPAGAADVAQPGMLVAICVGTWPRRRR
ncbi:hypothetical protein ACU4GD_13765 [Cupriavidus basilensis]